MLNAAQVKASAESKDKMAKKVQPEYASFDKVTDLVKQVMMQDRMPAVYTEKMNALKLKHKVEVNKECFKKFVIGNTAPAMAEMGAEEAPEMATKSA